MILPTELNMIKVGEKLTLANPFVTIRVLEMPPLDTEGYGTEREQDGNKEKTSG